MSKIRKDKAGSGDRTEKIRTYNFPQNRITDHRVDVTLKNLDVVMTGALDPIIEPLIAQVRDLRKQAYLAQFT